MHAWFTNTTVIDWQSLKPDRNSNAALYPHDAVWISGFRRGAIIWGFRIWHAYEYDVFNKPKTVLVERKTFHEVSNCLWLNARHVLGTQLLFTVC